MSAIQITLNLFAASIFFLGGLFVWPSRRNIVTWLVVPQFVVSMVIPLLAVNYSESYTDSTLEIFTLLNTLGAIFMLAGLLLGRQLYKSGKPQITSFAEHTMERIDLLRRLTKLMMFCVIVLILCYAWMGFLPIFAENPLLAKFFKGPYRDRYLQVAFFYRLAQACLVAVLPLSIAAAWQTKSRILIFLSFCAFALFAVALTRSTAFQGLLVVFALAYIKNWWRLAAMLIVLVCVYCFGSMFFYFFGLRDVAEFSLWQEIAWGAPDIKDQIQFLTSFIGDNVPLTWGMTFVGGLIPGNFAFNPSIFTLSVTNPGVDVSEIGSGGFRLSPPLYGYIAASWFGAVLTSLVTGTVLSVCVLKFRDIYRGDLLSRVVAFQVFSGIYAFYIVFYNLNYLGLVVLVALSYVLYDWPFRGLRKYLKVIPARG